MSPRFVKRYGCSGRVSLGSFVRDVTASFEKWLRFEKNDRAQRVLLHGSCLPWWTELLSHVYHGGQCVLVSAVPIVSTVVDKLYASLFSSCPSLRDGVRIPQSHESRPIRAKRGRRRRIADDGQDAQDG
jgi:hypothetical protein